MTIDTGAAVPAGALASAVVLLFARTPAERRVVDEWVERSLPVDAVVVPAAGGDVGGADEVFDRHPDATVVPVRAVWVTATRAGRRPRWTDAVAAVNARVPLAAVQAPLLRDRPERCRVVVGEPAGVQDLRERYARDTAQADSFAEYVRRQAELALDRAERGAVDGRYKLPRLVPEELKASRRFVDDAGRLAAETGQSVAEVLNRSGDYLAEMAAAHSRLAIDTFARFGRFLLRAYRIDVDQDGLEGLRTLNRSHALVFLPSHRSYLDPFVMRAVLLGAGFPANHCFAGSNMSWWPMGDWTRRTGNIVLRRSIGDDQVYKFVLREYLGYLIGKRLNLEWYIEGGRTRTGKLRPPKYGLLTYLVDAVEQLDAGHDVYLVPVSILYDGLPEVWSLAEEQRGGEKRPETIGWLLNYPRSTGRGFGSVNVCLGEPLSLRRALGSAQDDTRRHRVEKVAFEVCHRINRATPVTLTALVTLALLGDDDRALTLTEIGDVIDPFLRYFERRKIAVMGDLAEPGELRRTLEWLADTHVVVRFAGGLEPVWGISPQRHLEAAFYRNSIVHLLLDRAIVEIILAGAAEGRVAVETDAWAEALRLRDLFKFEFFFPGKAEYRENLEAELALIDADWARNITDPAFAARALADARPHLAHRALHSFVEAYHVTAERLAARPPAERIDEGTFIEECYGVARQRRMQHRLQASDAISTEVFRTALQVAAHRDLLGPGGAELSERRAAFAAELGELDERLLGMRGPTGEGRPAR